MSVIDIILRVDTICKKYEKYDVEKHSANDSPGDAFARLYSSFESQIDATSEVISRSDFKVESNLEVFFLRNLLFDFAESRDGCYGN